MSLHVVHLVQLICHRFVMIFDTGTGGNILMYSKCVCVCVIAFQINQI